MGELVFSSPAAGVVEVVIDRPPDNLLTVGLCAELTELLLSPPPGAHVLRLRAAGEVFCLGRERAGSTPGSCVRKAGHWWACTARCATRPW